MTIDYQVGSLAGGAGAMGSVLTVAGCWPENDFEPWAVDYWRSTGGSYGQGYPRDAWLFKGIAQAGVQALRLLIPGKSAQLYMRTRTDDEDTFKTFLGWAHWNRRAQGKRIWDGTYTELLIEWTRLEEVT